MIHRVPLYPLYLNVLVIATCGLIYELLAGTLASYLLGDSVTQFSLVIGVYLSAMGIGAWLSQYLQDRLARTFIEIELALSLVGGLSAPLLFVAFGWIEWFQTALFGLVLTIGTLVGLELPLLMRILKEHLDFSDLVSRVLTFDYIGSLLASILFPIILVPRMGLVRTSLLFGILNALVGLWGTYLLRPLLTERSLAGLRGRACLAIVILCIGMIKAERWTQLAEEVMLSQPIVYAQQTPFQRIVVTQNRQGFQLHLSGHLQFNSADEYRYHEALVHPSMSSVADPQRVLVLGGGDGLAVREILKYPSVNSVTLVDIDPAMTQLASTFPLLSELNGHALSDPRVRIVNRDAFVWIGEQALSSESIPFDVAIIDFPDPSSYSVGKLYTTRFFNMLHRLLTPASRVSIQCTSPLVAPNSYWCVLNTLQAAGFDTRPYCAAVPSFGVWGFALASIQPMSSDLPQLPTGKFTLRFLTPQAMAGLFSLPADIQPRETELNQLNNQSLVRYYDTEWSHHE
jgi:spermidine synthase